jgi:hypothetical protein
MIRTIGEEMKRCNGCDKSKLETDFCKNKRAKDGLNWTCKECVKVVTDSEEFKKKRRSRLAVKRPIRKRTQKGIETKKVYDVVYREQNSDKIRNYKKNWEIKNKDKPEFKLKRNLRRRIHHALKGKNKSKRTMELIGCSVDFFKSHIECLFQDGMSWENYGMWHLDHIKECFRFDLSDPKQQEECFHYTNQRPLWATDNVSRKRTP